MALLVILDIDVMDYLSAVPSLRLFTAIKNWTDKKTGTNVRGSIFLW